MGTGMRLAQWCQMCVTCKAANTELPLDAQITISVSKFVLFNWIGYFHGIFKRWYGTVLNILTVQYVYCPLASLNDNSGNN